MAIYTRNSACAPIRAEEGITGILCPPNSSTSFCDLPKDQQIGGYPSASQLADCPLDATTLDSEGRCVILEFPAFVLIGVYSPANRDETRDDFRLGFLNALDARVRNLVAAQKRVFLAGDLNIIKGEIDTANAEEQLRKYGMAGQEYVSTPARRLLNQLLVDGKVIGERDEGREQSVLWDICRGFHPGRKGMFTCWDTKKNARPGNFGSRIDYVLCSLDWKDWFCDSNIQEGLIGSDHCPVYAIIKDVVEVNGASVPIKDIMNPPGMFRDGIRLREWNNKDLLPTSAKLITEFDRRRNIRDMFMKRPSLPIGEGSADTVKDDGLDDSEQTLGTQQSSTPTLPVVDRAPIQYHKSSASTDISMFGSPLPISPVPKFVSMIGEPIPSKANGKRPAESSPSRVLKRSKSGGSSAAVSAPSNKGQSAKGQSSLKGFFKPKNMADGMMATNASSESESQESLNASLVSNSSTTMSSLSVSGDSEDSRPMNDSQCPASDNNENCTAESPQKPFKIEDQEDVVDPIIAKESWSKLLSKRVVPRCEHNEPCVSYLTKKPGINCGRSFYMCPRPLGPSGQKGKGTQWQCGTFIWSSDWTGDGT